MGVQDDWDIVIAGGGAAGCVLARRLAEQGAGSVLLLESGPALDDEAVRARVHGQVRTLARSFPLYPTN